jgi:hypothetical protein
LPVYHFSFDTSNLTANAVTWGIETTQGDLLVSVAGNIPLYFQATIKGKVLIDPNGSGKLPGQITFTKALSNINQSVNIALPASYPNLAIEPGFPLPPGTTMESVDLYGKVSQYFYITQASEADFISFYQNLAPTNGWMVEQTGPLENASYICKVCVILSNSKEKVRVVWTQDFHQTTIMVFNPPELY